MRKKVKCSIVPSLRKSVVIVVTLLPLLPWIELVSIFFFLDFFFPFLSPIFLNEPTGDAAKISRPPPELSFLCLQLEQSQIESQGINPLFQTGKRLTHPSKQPGFRIKIRACCEFRTNRVDQGVKTDAAKSDFLVCALSNIHFYPENWSLRALSVRRFQGFQEVLIDNQDWKRGRRVMQ